MRTIRHPLSGAIYDLTERGTIQVLNCGLAGEFTNEGVWLSGVLKQADPQLCVWIGGQQTTNRHQQAAKALTKD